jgi:hypothetical protein
MEKHLKSLLLLFFIIGSFLSFSQESDNLKKPENNSPINLYALFSIGITNPIYRDFATSPLFYEGIGIEISRTWMKRSEERERIFGIGFGISFQTARIPESDFIQPGSIAGFGKFDLFYQELWKLDILSDNKNNTKIGGAILTTQNVRGNPDLQNNTLGLENISNIMASAQWTRDITRTETKQLNFWIWKPNLNPVKRDLRFLLNVGVLNFNYRPGYAYAYDSELIGMETNPVEWAFSNYKWSMNGWRIKTHLEYIKYLPKGNARSWSYVWEAAHTPGKFEDFQMASHQLRYTIYFNSNKR